MRHVSHTVGFLAVLVMLLGVSLTARAQTADEANTWVTRFGYADAAEAAESSYKCYGIKKAGDKCLLEFGSASVNGYTTTEVSGSVWVGVASWMCLDAESASTAGTASFAVLQAYNNSNRTVNESLGIASGVPDVTLTNNTCTSIPAGVFVYGTITTTSVRGVIVIIGQGSASSAPNSVTSAALGAVVDGELACFDGTSGRVLQGCGGVTVDTNGLITIPPTGGVLVEQGLTGQYMDLYEGSGGGTDKIRMSVADAINAGGFGCELDTDGDWGGSGCQRAAGVTSDGVDSTFYAWDMDSATWVVSGTCMAHERRNPEAVTGVSCNTLSAAIPYSASTTATMTDFRCRFTNATTYSAGSALLEVWEYPLGDEYAGAARVGGGSGTLSAAYTVGQDVDVVLPGLPYVLTNDVGSVIVQVAAIAPPTPATDPDFSCDVTITVD
jgi:hypothetical protein